MASVTTDLPVQTKAYESKTSTQPTPTPTPVWPPVPSSSNNRQFHSNMSVKNTLPRAHSSHQVSSLSTLPEHPIGSTTSPSPPLPPHPIHHSTLTSPKITPSVRATINHSDCNNNPSGSERSSAYSTGPSQPQTATMPSASSNPTTQSSSRLQPSTSNQNIYNFTSYRYAFEVPLSVQKIQPAVRLNTAARGSNQAHFRGSSLTAEEMSGGITVPPPVPTTNSISANSPILPASPSSATFELPWNRTRGLSDVTAATANSQGSTTNIHYVNGTKHIVYAPPSSDKEKQELAKLRQKWNQREANKQLPLTKRVLSRVSGSGSHSDAATVTANSHTRSLSHNTTMDSWGAATYVDTPAWVNSQTQEGTNTRKPATKPAAAVDTGNRLNPKTIILPEPRRRSKFSKSSLKRLWIEFSTWFRTRLLRMSNQVRRKRI